MNAALASLMKNVHYCTLKQGGLAQLARALAWHARGHRFDSGILHKASVTADAFFVSGAVAFTLHFLKSSGKFKDLIINRI